MKKTYYLVVERGAVYGGRGGVVPVDNEADRIRYQSTGLFYLYDVLGWDRDHKKTYVARIFDYHVSLDEIHKWITKVGTNIVHEKLYGCRRVLIDQLNKEDCDPKNLQVMKITIRKNFFLEEKSTEFIPSVEALRAIRAFPNQ